MAIASLVETVRAGLQDLWKLDKAQCNQMLRSYNGTAAATSAEPMTARTLALTVVLMTLLAFAILWSGLARVVNAGRQGPNLKIESVVRTLLRVAFVLFLPALSSVFSLTKAEGGTGFLLTLLWLLLVELIRMNVQAKALPADGSSSAMDTADEVGHVLWAGYLVFFNMGGQSHNEEANKEWADAMKAMFALLWLLSFGKLVHRLFDRFTESLSWHTGRNPLLIAAYMQHLVTKQEEEQEQPSFPAAADPMESCQFVVEGEHQLVFDKKKRKTTTQHKVVTAAGSGVGRHVSVHLELDDNKIRKLVTVGKIWRWGKQPGYLRNLFSHNKGYLQDLCLSLSLFKLLRRRFEHYPMVEVGSEMVRSVMIKGLLDLKFAGDGQPADRPFRVLLLELDFLQHYYQTADRAVMSRRGLFLTKIAVSILFVPIYLVAILAILATSKDADYFYCMAMVSSGGRLENFPFLAFAITLALLATFVCFEAYEFFTSYFNYNWNLVRLVCYNSSLWATNRKVKGPVFRRILLNARYWIYSKTTRLFRRQAYIDVHINQVSIVDACGPPLDKLLSSLLPIHNKQISGGSLATKGKQDIIEAMKLITEETLAVSLPRPALLGAAAADDGHDDSAAGAGTRRRRRTATEIILASHLATELFLIKHPAEKKTRTDDGRHTGLGHGSARDVATKLSRYCMYLVAHMPGLLPDDKVWVSGRHKDMSTCLHNALGQHCGMPRSRCCCKSDKNTLLLHSLKAAAEQEDGLDDTTTRDAMEMFEKMENMEEEEVWEQLARFWVRMVIYVAPSDDVQSHAGALATSGADLISCLWAFCTHTGITREEPPLQAGGHGGV